MQFMFLDMDGSIVFVALAERQRRENITDIRCKHRCRQSKTNLLQFGNVSIVGFLKNFGEEEDRQNLGTRDDQQHRNRPMKEASTWTK